MRTINQVQRSNAILFLILYIVYIGHSFVSGGSRASSRGVNYSKVCWTTLRKSNLLTKLGCIPEQKKYYWKQQTALFAIEQVYNNYVHFFFVTSVFSFCVKALSIKVGGGVISPIAHSGSAIGLLQVPPFVSHFYGIISVRKVGSACPLSRVQFLDFFLLRLRLLTLHLTPVMKLICPIKKLCRHLKMLL